MGKLPRPGGNEMLRFLERQGYQIVRIRGSHHFLSDGTHRTSVPIHGNRPLKIGTVRSILRDLEMSPDEFEKRWNA